MNTVAAAPSLALTKVNLPTERGAYYGGKWHKPRSGLTVDQINPGTGESLGPAANCGAEDIDAAVKTAKVAFKDWRRVPPLERAKMLKEVARVLRANAAELAMIDATDCGGLVQVRLRDRPGADERQVPIMLGLVVRQLRLVLTNLGLRLVERRLIGPRVEFEQDVALLDRCPFLEVDLGEVAPHVRLHLDGVHRRCPCRKVGVVGDVPLHGVTDRD